MCFLILCATGNSPAAGLSDQVLDVVASRRACELRVLGDEKKLAFRAAQVGQMMRVLTLNRRGEDGVGRGPARFLEIISMCVCRDIDRPMNLWTLRLLV